MKILNIQNYNMGYGVYDIGYGRFGGWEVPAICEHPDCNKEIDRGISYACGGEPRSDPGCDKYFCEKHLISSDCLAHIDEDECEKYSGDCEYQDLCERCIKDEVEFDYKPEHPEWIKQILTHESWERWRKENPEEVKKLSTVSTLDKFRFWVYTVYTTFINLKNN